MVLHAVLLIVAALLTRTLRSRRIGTSVGLSGRTARAGVDRRGPMLRYSEARGASFTMRPSRASRGFRACSRWRSRRVCRFPSTTTAGKCGSRATIVSTSTADATEMTTVSPEYFSTIGIPIVEGRGFTADDRPNTPLVAVINETMARRYWPGQSAVGKIFHSRVADGPPIQIVGVTLITRC